MPDRPADMTTARAAEADDVDQLAEWLRGVITARDLDSIGIAPPR